MPTKGFLASANVDAAVSNVAAMGHANLSINRSRLRDRTALSVAAGPPCPYWANARHKSLSKFWIGALGKLYCDFAAVALTYPGVESPDRAGGITHHRSEGRFRAVAVLPP